MNLPEALDVAGVSWKPHRSREGEIYLCCPFCTERHKSPDYEFKLSVNYLTGLGHCFQCEWSSRDALRALGYMLQLGRLDPAENPQVSQKRPEPFELPDEYEALEDVSEGIDPLWQIKKYLLDRGITEQQIREKKIGGAVDGKYRYSAIFPVYYGELGLCGLISRDVTGQRCGVGADGVKRELRYLNSEGTKVAYNVPWPMPKNSIVVVTEGIIKALAVERCLNPKSSLVSVSVQGKGITDLQVTQFAGAKEVVLFSDPGRDGRVGFLNAANNIAPLFEKVSIAYPLPKKQADEMTKSEIIYHLKNRQRYTERLELQLKSKEVFGAYR